MKLIKKFIVTTLLACALTQIPQFNPLMSAITGTELQATEINFNIWGSGYGEDNFSLDAQIDTNLGNLGCTFYYKLEEIPENTHLSLKDVTVLPLDSTFVKVDATYNPSGSYHTGFIPLDPSKGYVLVAYFSVKSNVSSPIVAVYNIDTGLRTCETNSPRPLTHADINIEDINDPEILEVAEPTSCLNSQTTSEAVGTQQGITTMTTQFVINSKTYTLNDVEKSLTSAPYISKDGFTMIPLSALFDMLSLTEDDYSFKAGTLTMTVGEETLVLKNNSKSVTVNKETIKMGTPMTIKDGKTFVPASQIAEILGIKSTWDKETKTVTFTK